MQVEQWEMVKTLHDRQWLQSARSFLHKSDLISMRLLPLCIQLMLLTACVSSVSAVKYEDLGAAPYSEAKQVGRLDNVLFTELSGLTQSQQQNNLFWSHNDGGHPPLLFALDRSGQLKAKLKIEQTRNTDWEDLDSFLFEQQSYFLVADVGDNFARRDHIELHVIREPKLSQRASEQLEKAEPVESLTAPILYTLQIQYEEGPRDCEAVAVDVQQQKALLLTKRDEPALLFEVSLRNVFKYLRQHSNRNLQIISATPESFPVADSTVKQHISPLQKPPVEQVNIGSIGTLIPLPKPTLDDLTSQFINVIYSSQPTSMDISSKGDRAIVLTYRYAYEFSRSDTESWQDALSKTPRIIKFPSLKQAEAISYTANDRGIVITSESVQSPIFELLKIADVH